MIHIYKSKNKKFYVVVKARNGYVLSTSEMFKNRAAAIKNIAAIKSVMRMAGVKVKDHTL